MREIKKLNLVSEVNKKKLEQFYIDNCLESVLPEEVAVLIEGGKWLGVSGRDGELLLGFAFDDSIRGEGALDDMLSFWIKDTFDKYDTLFIFTKREYSVQFQNGGFKELAHTEKSAFLIRSQKTISQMLGSPIKREGEIGCAVMHANPTTLGHLSLIKRAKKECDYLYVFLLSNDSLLPYEIRRQMLTKSLDMENIEKVEVVKGGSLIISRATFPSYFLKEKKLIDREHAIIDALVFKNYVVDEFGIVKRFLGSEPLDKSTAIYNKVIEKVLNPEVEVKIFERLEHDGRAISATRVRKSFLEKDYKAVKSLVPSGTYQVLIQREDEVRKCWMS